MDAKHKYTVEIKSDGRPFYYRDGRNVAKTKIPKEEIVKLQRELEEQGKGVNGDEGTVEETVDDTPEETATVKPERASYDCLMCSLPATRQRFVNLQIIHLCEDHYFSCTLGRLVIKLREIKEYEPVLPN